MNQFKTFKVVQISALAALAVMSIIMLMRPDVKTYIFSTGPATTLFFLVWAVLILSFIFIIIDFATLAKIKKGDHTLYDAAYSDQISGIPNRFSCDTIIEKYFDMDLPEELGCIMIDLTNLGDINKQHNHKTGNQMIKEFSGILSSAALSLCFVGRNGGNKFLAVFEGCTKHDMYTFLQRVSERVETYNANPGAIPIQSSAGAAYNGEDKLNDITELIALANRRIKPTA